MSIAGMILGIMAIMFAWIPIIGFISIPLVIIGLPLSIFGLLRSRTRRRGIGMAVTGLVTNTAALSFSIFYAFTLVARVEEIGSSASKLL